MLFYENKGQTDKPTSSLTAMRASIKSHLQPYFRALQGQMECNNTTEALNHLLMDLKRRGYSFLDEYQYKPAIAPQPPQKESLPQDDIPQNDDPYIRRLIEIGMEEF
ncbi:hypothetical protein [Dendronalium sp. ChiSLP03b]|uniref:hypothetical protein n=1 Tax=Dendronalium sp. ChiSLP03b TaxID=3075381 RepID=UPI003919DE9C